MRVEKSSKTVDMTKTTKTYVAFDDTRFTHRMPAREVENRDIKTLEFPSEEESVIGFHFYDKKTTSINVGGEKLIKTKDVNESPRYYYGGKVMTVEELKKRPETSKFNKEYFQEWEKVIITRNGVIRPFRKKDLYVVPETREIKRFSDFPSINHELDCSFQT